MTVELPETPENRKEQYLAAIAGQKVELPDEPANRIETYLAYIAENGGGGGGGGDSSAFTYLSDADANYTYDGEPRIAVWKLPTGTYRLKEGSTISFYLGTYNGDILDGWNVEAQPTVVVTNFGFAIDVMAITSLNIQYCNIDEYGEITESYMAACPFSGTDGTANGESGLVPAPTTEDVDKFLCSDGTWATPSGGVTPVQTTGTSTTDVMSQDAVTKITYPRYGVFNDAIAIRGADEVPDSSAGFMSTGFGAAHYARGANSVAVGYGATVYANGEYSIAIGNSSKANNNTRALAIGNAAEAANNNSVAIGTNAKTTRVGEMNVGAGTSGRGYNDTNYRVIGGVHDGQLANDAATVGQINATIDAINTALSTNIPHIGA